ncbi:hypothetical protein EIP86_006991 [Pleurotus ostreatoroseus]|nr:hypothetical protein EIP86_006991 [Pleurotus ostreatoroseus]
MASSYLTIPATSVSVERVFGRGRLLSHVRNRTSAESARALLCVGEWTRLGLVKDEDIKAATRLPPVDSEDRLEDDWAPLLRVKA